MNLDLIEKNVILSLTVDFSLNIIEYCEKLGSDRKYVLSRQLLKSGTSVGANSFEAQSCESTADFIHKFKIASKEVNETQYWLLLCKKASSYPDWDLLIRKIDKIDKIINKIISTTRKKKPLSYLMSLFMF